MPSKYLLGWLLLCCLMPALGLAALDNVEDQKAMMEAQIELLKKQADLNAALKALSPMGAQALPSVVSIALRGPVSFARLLMPSGESVVFKPGERIHQGLTLASIEDKAVWVHVEQAGMAKTLTRLEFAQLSSKEPVMGPGPWNSKGTMSRAWPIGPMPLTPLALAPLPLAPLPLAPLPLTPLPAMSSPGPMAGASTQASPTPRMKDPVDRVKSSALEELPPPAWMSRRTR